MDYSYDPNMTLEQYEEYLYHKSLQSFCCSYGQNYNDQRYEPLETYNFSSSQPINLEPSGGYETYLASWQSYEPAVSEHHLVSFNGLVEETLEEEVVIAEIAHKETIENSYNDQPSTFSSPPQQEESSLEKILMAFMSESRTQMQNLENQVGLILKKINERGEEKLKEDNIVETENFPISQEMEEHSEKSSEVSIPEFESHVLDIMENPTASLPSPFIWVMEVEAQKDSFSAPFFVFPNKSKEEFKILVVLSLFKQISSWHELKMPSAVLANARRKSSNLKF